MTDMSAEMAGALRLVEQLRRQYAHERGLLDPMDEVFTAEELLLVVEGKATIEQIVLDQHRQPEQQRDEEILRLVQWEANAREVVERREMRV